MEKNQDAILQFLYKKASADVEEYVDGDTLRKATNLSPVQINDAIELLFNSGLVERYQTLGTTPYKFWGVKITPSGKFEVERKKALKRAKVTEKEERVFIVHGHDELPKEQLARILTEIGFQPIILHEQPDRGRTIIEKFEEECKDVGFAFVIITPDDVGMDRESYEKMKVGKYENGLCYRARQNVIFELGFFYGKLGRDRVCCLYKGNVEILSDISGVLYIEFKEKIREKYTDIIRELRAAGYEPKV